MRNLFHRILSALNIKGRDWVVFLLALLLAFSIWLIHNLALNYKDIFSVSVVAQCNISGHAEESANKCDVTARCKATGYKLIRAHLGRKAQKVVFDPSDLMHYDADMFYLTSDHLQEYSHQIFGPGVSVEYYLSDTLFFRFPYENSKKVRIEPISVVTFRDQYMADGSMSVDPDSMYIYGEPYILDGVDKVYTRTISETDVSENVSGMIGLEKIKGVRFSVDQVRYQMNVKRYVELELNLPVRTVNVPQGAVLRVYPSDARVRLRCSFPLIEDPEKGLFLVADYNDYVKSRNGKCTLKLSGLSRGIIGYQIEPVSVSGLIEGIH